MAKTYQPHKNNKYWLPHHLYMQTLYLIRDYDRLQREYHDLIDETAKSDGQPRASGPGDPTGKKAIKLESTAEKLRAVEQSSIMVPEEYRNHVMANVMYGSPFPRSNSSGRDIASKNTWSIHRCRFIYHVAERMRWI